MPYPSAARMRAVAFAAALLILTAGLPMADGRSASPKLAVLIVVDQMRADYVDRFRADWTGGLARLIADGAWFRQAAYPYLNTVTCAGHATVATGTYPRSHGIIQNAWFDRGLGRAVACTSDANGHDIGYEGAVEGGDSAARLLRPTFADQMRRTRAAHVVSLSLKARSAIMLAGHGGDAVTWLGDGVDGWATSSAFASAPVAEVKAFTDANPMRADYGKTWTRLLPPARYAGPDDGEGEAPPAGWTPTFPHPLTGQGRTDARFLEEWETSPFADAYLGRFAAALAGALKLGRHDGTDVLAISFSSTDLVGHAFGPRSQEVQDMYARLDRTIGALLDRLDQLVGRDAYVVALTADHGVTPIPEQLKHQGEDAGRLVPAALAAVIEAQARARLGPGRYVARVNGNDVYFEPGMYQRLRRSPAAMKAVVGALEASDGVARVFPGEELRAAADSSDPARRAAALSYFPGRSGDLILVPKPGWMFSAHGTTHGTSNADDQAVPILLFGPGIRPGEYRQPATPADVAPTLAALCGTAMPDADGRVLREALERSPVSAAH